MIVTFYFDTRICAMLSSIDFIFGFYFDFQNI